jgi:arylsulfatase A-like enzyme
MIQTTAIRAAASAVPWRAVAAVVLAAGTFAAGWAVNGWRKDAEIAQMKESRATSDLASANQALTDLREAGATIREKADEFRGIRLTLDTKLDAIRKDIKNATPLPADCRPDDQRLRNLTDAVSAAKQAAAAR